jgi:hypothetical protein
MPARCPNEIAGVTIFREKRVARQGIGANRILIEKILHVADTKTAFGNLAQPTHKFINIHFPHNHNSASNLC